MDEDERRRKQYGPPVYPSSSPTGAPSAQQMSYQQGERYSQAMSRGESARSLISRPATGPSYGGYGYTEQQSYTTPAMQGQSLQYQPAFPQDSSRQQQSQQISSQQFPQYAGPVMYNLGPAGQQQLPYDPSPQYHERQSAAIEVLSNQFGVPQYFGTAEPVSAGLPAVQASYVASQIEPVRYAHTSPIHRPNIAESYEVEMDYSPMGTSHAQVSQQTLPSSESMEDAFHRYERQVDAAFQAVIAGRLAEASEEILSLSNWLLPNVAKLGLHHDEPNPEYDPLQIWRRFNNLWLALGQKQKELTEGAIRWRSTPSSLLPGTVLRAMVNDLLKHDDNLEQYSLLDYDRGVAEEEIVNVFSQCIELNTVYRNSAK